MKKYKTILNYDNLQKTDKKRSILDAVYVFSICSILGFIVETIFVYISSGVYSNRGMLYGPYCPIYGFGGVILYFLFCNLKPSKANIPYAFLVSAVFMGAFELLSGIFLKNIFNVEMWNYDGMFLAIMDYTTVPILIGWGILGTIYIFFLQPLLHKIIEMIPKTMLKRLAILIIFVYLIDFGLSVRHIILDPDFLRKMVTLEAKL